jgi:energy-coupling factor transport system permease protein
VTAVFTLADPGSRLRRLDPRVRLLWVILVWVVAAFAAHTVALALLPLAVLGLSAAGGIGLRPYRAALVSLAVVGVQLFLVQAVFGRAGEVVLTLGPVDLHSGSLAAAGIGALRLSALCLSALQFAQTTAPEELVLLLVWARLPYRYAALAGFALRFLPLMESELRAVFEAQSARGIDLGGPVALLGSFTRTLTPLLLRGLRRAEEASLSLELRGFGHAPSRTFVGSLRFGRADALVLAAMTLFAALSLAPR